MASILQQLLGGGTPPETLGRKATAVGDRDVASRDTVRRKPAPKPAAPAVKSSAGGGGGGAPPRQAPVPTPRPDPNLTLGGTPTAGYGSPSTFPARPEMVPPQMPQMPPQLPGLPIELQGQTAMPNPALAGAPQMPPPSTFPPRPDAPLSDNRAALAALMQPQPQPQQQGSMLPGEDAMNRWGNQPLPGEEAMNRWGKQHLPWIFGR